VALGVGVDDEHPLLVRGQSGGEFDRSRGLLFAAPLDVDA
jgi:hypothetical protein